LNHATNAFSAALSIRASMRRASKGENVSGFTRRNAGFSSSGTTVQRFSMRTPPSPGREMPGSMLNT